MGSNSQYLSPTSNFVEFLLSIWSKVLILFCPWDCFLSFTVTIPFLLSVYLSVCFSVCLSVCLSVRLSVCLSVSFSKLYCKKKHENIIGGTVSVSLAVCLCVCLFVGLSVCLPEYAVYLDIFQLGRKNKGQANNIGGSVFCLSQLVSCLYVCLSRAAVLFFKVRLVARLSVCLSF